VVLTGGGIESGGSISVTPPGGAPQLATLEEEANNLPGLLVAHPLAEADVEAFGTWAIEIAAADVPDPANLENLIVVVRYTEGA